MRVVGMKLSIWHTDWAAVRRRARATPSRLAKLVAPPPSAKGRWWLLGLAVFVEVGCVQMPHIPRGQTAKGQLPIEEKFRDVYQDQATALGRSELDQIQQYATERVLASRGQSTAVPEAPVYRPSMPAQPAPPVAQEVRIEAPRGVDALPAPNVRLPGW